MKTLMRLPKFAVALATILSFVAPTLAKAEGSDGVELEIVPVDAGVDCSSIILKGTRRFEGTAFVMPRVVVGITKENEDLFQIIPNGEGGYLLSMGLYFPSPADSTELRAGRSNLYLHGCNFDRALHQINKDIPKDRPQVTRLARLPVRNIEVIVDGISDRALIGETKQTNSSGDETSILNYEGTDHTVEFNLSAKEKEALLRRLERKQGISIKVNMKFSARESDGTLYAEVDLENLALNLQANLKGKYMVASGELKSAITNALANTRINIKTEAGKSQLFEKISENLMTMILANVTDATAAPETPKPSEGGSSVTDALPANIRVDAVLGLLRTQKKRVVNYSNVTELKTHVYTTPVNFQVRLQDPDVHEMYIRAGEKPTMVPGEIKAGDRVTIAVGRSSVEKISYKPIVTYLTASQLTRLNLAADFPRILDEDFSIENVETRQGWLAVGKEIKGLVKRAVCMGLCDTPNYFWVRTEWVPKYNTPEPLPVPIDFEKLRDGIALNASFTRVGTRYFRISDLVQDNAYWTGKYDPIGGKIELTAKRDLGYLNITGFSPPQRVRQIYDQVQEEVRVLGKAPVRSEPKRTRERVVEVERFAYLVYVGRPSANPQQAERVLTPISRPSFLMGCDPGQVAAGMNSQGVPHCVPATSSETPVEIPKN